MDPRRADPPAVADRLHSAAIHLLRRLRKQDEATGLTPARLSALSVIVFAGPITMGQLASAEQVAAPTMTRLVSGMERDGLLERTRDTRDRRVVWISATPTGNRVLQEGRRRRVRALTAEMAALDRADLELLARSAKVIERIAAAGPLPPNTP